MTPTTPELARPGALRSIKDLPSPSGLPLLGNLLQVKPTRFHLQLEQWCRELGPYFQLRLGRIRILVVADHAVVATVLRDRPDGFRRSIRLEQIGTEMGLLPGVFGANGDTWRQGKPPFRLVCATAPTRRVRRFGSLQRCAS